ncbi:hypothetical protein ACHAWX_001027 [Stephanocyclus meneghinianus]
MLSADRCCNTATGHEPNVNMNLKMSPKASSLPSTMCKLHSMKAATVAARDGAPMDVTSIARLTGRRRYVMNLAMLSLLQVGMSLSSVAALQSTSCWTASHPLKHEMTPTAASRHRRHREMGVSSALFSFHKSHPPDSESTHSRKQRTDTKRHSHSPAASPLLNTAHHAKHAKHIQVAHGRKIQSSSPQATIDRLRVELMRSQLSVSIAEQRARQLEAQLNDMTNNYQRAHQLLLQRDQNGHLNQDQAHLDKTHTQINPPKQRNKKNSSSMVAPAAHKGGIQSTHTLSTPFTGNSFDDLPPFAAALAANAEREERQKRRRLGLIQEADMELDSTSGRADSDHASFHDMNSVSSMLALDSDAGTHNFYLTTNTQASNITFLSSEHQLSSLVDEKKKSITATSTPYIDNPLDNFASLLPSDADNYTDLGQTLNNSTINHIDLQYSPTYVHDDIQTLRQKCILLIRQQAVLQQKLSQSEALRNAQHAELKASMTAERVLRGLQADWTRRLAETRKEMDGQKEEWKRELKNTCNEWEKEKMDLQNQIQLIKVERDELLLLMENQKNIKFVMALFCDLATEHISSTLKEGKSKIMSTYSNSTSKIIRRVRYGKNPPPNRILTVGGATDQTSKRAAVALFISGVTQKVMSLKERVRKRPGQTHSTIDDFPIPTTEPEVKTNTSSLSDNHTMPQLIRKNPRRSRPFNPESAFGPKISQKSTDTEVPYFMRGD